jgi:hypothetical protein
MDYAYHTIDTIQCLISNPSFHPSREFVTDKSYSVYPYMCRRIYRILAHINNYHPDLYLKYENECSLFNGFVTFCLQFQFMKV